MNVRRRFLLVIGALVAGACSRSTPPVLQPAPPSSASPRALAVYRAIAESIYVRTTSRVVAVATSSLDGTCTLADCSDLSGRWGVENLWFATGDSSEARSARTDLLKRSGPAFDVSSIVRGRAMLLETDAGDIPLPDANIAEWIRFRSTHADAAGAVRMSPVGFSESGKTAIAYVDWRCGPTCGHTVGVALTALTDSTWGISEMLLLSSRDR